MKSLAIIAVLFISQSLANPAAKPKADATVTVNLYYDVFNDASLKLLTAQNRSGIWDLMMAERTEVAVNFNPFASGTVDGSTLTCQGDEECKGTKVTACVIHAHENEGLIANHEVFHLLVCAAGHDNWQTDPLDAMELCFNEVAEFPDDAFSLEPCTRNDTLMTEYMTAFRADADAAKVTSVPWVVINGEAKADAATDLLAYVCDAFGDTKPGECDGVTLPGGGGGAGQLIYSQVFTLALLFVAIFGLRN